MRNKLKLIAGNANRQLAREISDYLETPLCKAKVGRFPDGEIEVQIGRSVRGGDVFVVQPTCPPVNENLMELLVMIDALKRASAERITAVIPYYGYGRQDRKHVGRVPISARLVADLIEAAGADRVLAVDLHAGQIQGFFNIPADNLLADPVFIDYFRSRGLVDEETVILSPDLGAVKRARGIAAGLGLPLAIVEKRRTSATQVETYTLIGEVEGKRAIIVDDIIATGGTVHRALELLRKGQAREVYGAFTHGVFAGDVLDRLAGFPLLKKIIVTNTIPPNSPSVEVVSIGELLSKAIARIHREESISELLEWKPDATE